MKTSQDTYISAIATQGDITLSTEAGNVATHYPSQGELPEMNNELFDISSYFESKFTTSMAEEALMNMASHESFFEVPIVFA